MAHYEGSYLVMSEAELNDFLERSRHPDTVQRRQAFFAELDRVPITEHADGSVDLAFTPRRNADAESTKYTAYRYAVEDFRLKSVFSSDRTSKTGEYDVSDISLWAA